MQFDSGQEIIRLLGELQDAQGDYLRLEDEIRAGNLGSDVVSSLAHAHRRVYDLMRELERLDWQAGMPI